MQLEIFVLHCALTERSNCAAEPVRELPCGKCPGAALAFQAAYSHPELIPIAEARNDAPADQLSRDLVTFALAQEADDIGITPIDPLYVFEGYSIDEPWVIVLALAHNYERLKEVPSAACGICIAVCPWTRSVRRCSPRWRAGLVTNADHVP